MCFQKNVSFKLYLFIRFCNENDSFVPINMFMLISPIIVVGQSKGVCFQMVYKIEVQQLTCILGGL